MKLFSLWTLESIRESVRSLGCDSVCWTLCSWMRLLRYQACFADSQTDSYLQCAFLNDFSCRSQLSFSLRARPQMAISWLLK